MNLNTLQINPKNYQTVRFGLYILVILLLNGAASFFSVRADLTEQKTYSLAPASKETVAQLEEPVTIRAYLSSNLPAQYNILSSLLRDLLQTYQSNARSGMFSYSVNIISSGDKSEKTKKIEQEAEKYGIYKVNLQGSDGNESKTISAYIGMAISQGENLEVLSPLIEDNIQYRITAALQKMSRKSSALLSMKEDLKIYYYFSPLLKQFENGKYASFPDNFNNLIATTKEQLYGRLESQVVDPTQLPSGLPEPGELDLPETEITAPNSEGLDEVQKVYSAIVIDNEGKYQSFSLLRMQPTLQLGPEGLTQSNTVQVIDPNQLEGQLTDIAISTLGIAQNIGYIADRETASFSPPNPQIPPQGANLYQLSNAAADLYNFQAVNLDEGIAKDINILMLVDPMAQLSDWDLYQLDQFIMRGGRLIVAMQPYQVMQNPYSYGAQFIPNPNIEGIQGETAQQHTLTDLLKHYGIRYSRSMVFDKHSFIQRGQDPQTGGYQEKQIYYIPEILMKWGSELPFIKGLKLVYFMNSAPLNAEEAANEEGEDTEDSESTKDIEAQSQTVSLLKSSPESWTEKMEEGNKDPNSVLPSADLQQYNLIVATRGPLSSFFKGKAIPEKPSEEDSPVDQSGADQSQAEDDLSLASIQNSFIEETQYGKVLVSGSSLVFDAQLLGLAPNKSLALNLLDYMAGNETMADLRARSGIPNLIDDKVSNNLKNFIKWFNVIGLPIAVAIFGILMLLNWRQRQLQLRNLFSKAKDKESSE